MNPIKHLTKRILTKTNNIYRLPGQRFSDLSLQQTQRFNDKKNQKQKNNKNEFKSTNIVYPIVGVAIGTMAICGVMFKSYYQSMLEKQYEESDEHTIMNYSGTHSSTPMQYFQPNTIKEVENLVKYCHDKKISFRPMGTGLSPNGIGFSNAAIMDMSHCNRILDVDKDKMQITVEAGCKLKDVINAIIPYEMALQNIPSIQEQQIGGLIQVGAHGTGIDIPPCDMQVVKMTLVTPNGGRMELTPKDDLFYYARVGLGAVGVVTEVTLQCVERHKLAQYMWVMDKDELIAKRNQLLSDYKHVQWLWIPHTDKVVVVVSNEMDDPHFEALYAANVNEIDQVDLEAAAQKPLRDLLYSKTGKTVNKHLSFADLRDLLLGYNDANDILRTDWIREINFAELEYWENASKKFENIDMSQQIDDKIPQQIDYTENVLSFECGGQQWVYEICFPMKKYHDFKRDGDVPSEIELVEELLDRIKAENIPAPVPLEHRFTGSSSSKLSPANGEQNDKFSWLGIILYLPTQDEQRRRWISNEFHTYCQILDDVADKYGAVGHWAKIETHYLNKYEREKLQERLKNKYGNKLSEFLKIRDKYDPNGILVNDVVSDFFHI